MPIRPLRIELLGGLRVHREDQVITRFRSKSGALLLAYLAFYHTQPHLRERMLDLLWPDSDVDAARNRLRVTLSSLRRQLEAPGSAGADAVLFTDRLHVGLRAEAIVTDVGQFETALEAALHSDTDNACTARLAEAASLYKGDLLPDSYADWITQERQRLAHVYRTALRRLVRACVRERDFERALEYALKAVSSDPLDEEAHRDVMRLHGALGRPAAAQQQFAELERLLAEAVRAVPASSTRELLAQIAAQASHAPPPDGPPVPGPGPTTRERSPSRRSPDAESAALPSACGLPISLTRFFGRSAEIALLRSLLAGQDAGDMAPQPRRRLVTLTGPGGAGKTRLALEVAQRIQADFDGRAWFVSLADVQDRSMIVDAIARALRLAGHGDPMEQVIAVLGAGPALLVMDNLEHLTADAADVIVLLLEHVPELTCLATSRRNLGVSGEREVAVMPLPIWAPPDSDSRGAAAASSRLPTVGELLGVPGIQLFVDRAQAILPDFQLTSRNCADIAALCRALDGLPLAIELAAARVRVLTPHQILANMARRFELLVDRRASKDTRHRSLRAVMEWSFQLLSPALRRAMAELSVFRGGWNLRAAEAVCDGPDMLGALDQLRCDSLVLADQAPSELRFRMLESVREYAAEHLHGDWRLRVRFRHVAYHAELAAEAAAGLRGPGQAHWLDLLQADLDNIRAALDYSREDPAGAREGLDLIRHLWRFWLSRGCLAEARERAASAIAHAGAATAGDSYIGALNVAGALAAAQDDFAAARPLYDRALRLARESGCDHGIAMALGNIGTLEMRSGNLAEAKQAVEASLALHRRLGNVASIADSLSYLAVAALQAEDFETARSLYGESLAMHRALGDRIQVATALGNLGLIAEHENDLEASRALHDQSLAIHHELSNRIGAGYALANLGLIAKRQGDCERARHYFRDCVALFRELGMPQRAAAALEELGGVGARLGEAGAG
ncbi:MAG TPA: tetratricopeptide repeat protein [Chthonomonadaceae bacterium]|nr:tetratricopeptide repeat protein [Chthonomonadaceae bacterium]